MSGKHRLACALLTLGIGLGVAPSAEACGGGVSPPTNVSVNIAAQRSLISVRDDGMTHVVLELRVPEAASDYGVLVPLPAEPIIDPEPVPASEMDELDLATAPIVQVGSSGESSGSGFGCGSSAAAGDGSRSANGNSVFVSSQVDIGPITAVALSGSSGSAIAAWLAENGFVIPAEHQATIDSYVAASPWFLAFKPNQAVSPGQASAIGVHYALAGDHRAYAMRMSRLGAAPELAITVFVAADAGVAPAGPYSTILPHELALNPASDDPDTVAAAYREAVHREVSMRMDKAFVLEGIHEAHSLALGSRLSTFVDSTDEITRLTTVVTSSKLDLDVAFTDPAPSSAGALSSRPSSPWRLPVLTTLLGASLALFARRRPFRRTLTEQ